MNYNELTQCSFLLDEDHFIYDTSEDSETVQLGHLASPFDQEKMSRLLTTVDDYLSQISETELR